MEAKELRIGNYVYSNKFVIKSYGVDGFINILKNIDNFTPIPLTEEWLLKFGFVFDSYGEYCKGAYSLDNEYTDKGVYNFVIHKETCLDIEIKYLHQLQNLYFALTNEELTIQ